MSTSQKKNSLSTVAFILLCCLLTGWMFSLPIPEFNPSSRYNSNQELLSIDKAGAKQLKTNDAGITSTAARFNATAELREVVEQKRATLDFLFNYKNFTFFHTRLFYNSLAFINHRHSVYAPDFFILFRQLRL